LSRSGTVARRKAPLVVAVTSGKGGVGKTNLCVNLGVEFVNHGKRTLIIDGDLGLANVDILFNIRPKFNFSHLISGEKTIEEVITNGPGGIRILPAASGISAMADLKPEEQSQVVAQLETLSDKYDIILIDTAAGISSHVLYFASAASYIIIIATPEPTSLADAYAIIKVLNRQYAVKRFQLVVNQAASEQNALSVYQTLCDIADNFIEVAIDFLGFMPRDEKVHEAVNSQVPFVEKFPSSGASRELKKIAAGLLKKRDQVPDNLFLWNRLAE